MGFEFSSFLASPQTRTRHKLAKQIWWLPGVEPRSPIRLVEGCLSIRVDYSNRGSKLGVSTL
jgi:hypothetical protein